MIIQQLNQIQTRFGYLPRESLVALGERLAVPLYRIEEVVSFFPHYHKTPPPEIEIHVCRDMSCHLRGSAAMLTDIEQQLAPEIAAGRATVCGVSCLGRCDRAPAARIHHLAGSKPAPGEPHQHAATLNFFARTSAGITDSAQRLL